MDYEKILTETLNRLVAMVNTYSAILVIDNFTRVSDELMQWHRGVLNTYEEVAANLANSLGLRVVHVFRSSIYHKGKSDERSYNYRAMYLTEDPEKEGC